jgi:genome maintenance exonuclease 1
MTKSFELWSTETFTVPSKTVVSANAIPSSTIIFAPRETLTNVSEVTTDNGRWYTYDGNIYPSATTMISATDTEGQQALKEWRQRIGKEEATKITTKAASRGNNWHKFSELFFAGKPTWPCLSDTGDVQYGAMFANVLNTKIKKILASEARVVSNEYGLAGRVDVCAELHDGRVAIVDFKTGKKMKTGNRFNNYMIQTTFYADALTEIWSDVTVDTVIVAQLLPNEIIWQESLASDWRPMLVDRISQYASILNTEMDKLSD